MIMAAISSKAAGSTKSATRKNAQVQTRGIRNNNPLNIRHSTNKWQGMAPSQSDRAFVQFTARKYGYRAAFVLIRNYIGLHHANTIGKIVARWAPSSDGNNTQTYNTFVSRVSDGRGLSFEAVDSIGGGRVWAGADALSNGLVDQLGNLDDAIDYAVEQSCVGDDFKVEAYPKLDDSMTAIMKQMGLSVRAGIGNALLGAEFNQVEKMRERLKTPEGLVWAVCDIRAE